jgi:hypothetical protein
MVNHNTTTICTIGGALFSILAGAAPTILLATLGAVSSFVATLACKAVYKYVTEKFKKGKKK